MSYPTMLDEYSDDALASELARRKGLRQKGLCDYCGYGRCESIQAYLERNGRPSKVATNGPCRFPERHNIPLEDKAS